jgi:hypothetical protein
MFGGEGKKAALRKKTEGKIGSIPQESTKT